MYLVTTPISSYAVVMVVSIQLFIYKHFFFTESLHQHLHRQFHLLKVLKTDTIFIDATKESVFAIGLVPTLHFNIHNITIVINLYCNYLRNILLISQD